MSKTRDPLTLSNLTVGLSPDIRIERLEFEKIAHFVKSEADMFTRALDHVSARVENCIIERMLTGRIRKAIRNLDDPDYLSNLLETMRRDYETGHKSTLHVMSAASESLESHGALTSDDALMFDYAPPRPNRKPDKPVMLYVAGGGFIFPPSKKQIQSIDRLSEATGCKTILGQHRLAPEDPFPAAPNDIVKQYLDLIEGRASPQYVFLAGDTAGASVVLSAVQILRVQSHPMPAGIILFSPWCDLSLSGWSYITRGLSGTSPFRMETAAFCARLYLQGHTSADPQVSAVFADCAEFPPLSIHTSKYDMHFDDAISLAESMRAAGRSVQVSYWDTPRHHLERLNSKDARASFEIARNFIQRTLRANRV